LLWFRRSKEPAGSLENDVSDAELVERLRLRDERGFLQLYDLYSGTVYRFLMHMTGSMVLAEELTQDVFVAILDSVSAKTGWRFDPLKGNLEGYLLGIARNLARAEQRRANCEVSLDNVVETAGWNRLLNAVKENPTWDLAAQMAERSELTALYNAILELPQHYREAIVLCGLQGKSYRDTAAILQCSEGTIASRVNRAKALLAAKLPRATLSATNTQAIRQGKGGGNVRTTISANGV
jgi:RNA polymerase sigma-70 factor (ECF subfamily)